MQIPKNRCSLCGTQLRGSFYKATGICNYCHNDPRRAGQYLRARQGLGTPRPFVSPPAFNLMPPVTPPPKLDTSGFKAKIAQLKKELIEKIDLPVKTNPPEVKQLPQLPCTKCAQFLPQAFLTDGLCAACLIKNSLGIDHIR